MKSQRGIVLIGMLAALAIGAGWFMVSRLHSMSADYTIAVREQNAAVLRQAKQALMLYVARQAAIKNEDNPGAFLCPEASGYVGTGNEGLTASSCSLPAVGRLPWKTIGMEKLLDASGEPLWYVVANGWAKPNSSTNTIINSNCNDSTSGLTCWSGQLTVDGTPNAAVALIIAPGAAMNVAASTGCTARNQSRSTPDSNIDARDYVECYSTATSSFSTTESSGSLNDQVITITAAEILPLIETAVADRVGQEFGAQMKTAYSGGSWTTTTVLPYAAPFANPTTSAFQGTSGTMQGLPPLNYAYTASPGSGSACSPAPCTPIACTTGSTTRCNAGFVTWQSSATVTRLGGAFVGASSCSVAGTPSVLTCTIYVYDGTSSNPSMNFTFAPRANNVGMSLRQINNTVPIGGLDTLSTQTVNPTPSSSGVNPPYGYCFSSTSSTTCSGSASLINTSDGSATLNLIARIPTGGGTSVASSNCGFIAQFFGWPCYLHTVTVPMALLSDHPLVDPGNSTYTWFTRNRWHEVAYYAIASGVAPSGARSCTTDTNPTTSADGSCTASPAATTCLCARYHRDAGKQRGVMFIAGSKTTTQSRPPTLASDLLEDANSDGTSPFAVRAPTLTSGATTVLPPFVQFNDRMAVIDSN